MIKKLLLILLAAFLSWTQSSGQTLVLEGDTVRCYTLNELRIIAMKVVEANECDTLLSLVTLESVAKDSIIFNLDRQVRVFKSSSELNATMLKDNEILLSDMQAKLDLEIRNHKKTKFQWYISLSLTTLVAGYFLFN